MTIGTAVLQTQLTQRLPSDFVSQVSGSTSLAYSLIPVIPHLQEPLQSEVREAFASSISVIWKVMIGIASIGLLMCPLMKGLPLHTEMDKRWALEHHTTLTELKDVAGLRVATNYSSEMAS